MAEAVYLLCAATSMLCATLLLRSYSANETRLLLWSSFCFVALALNNALLFVDLVVAPAVDLFYLRNAAGLVGLMGLVFGLIWDSE